MKKMYLISIFLLIAVSTASGQFFKQADIDIYKDDIAKQARDLVKDHLELTPEQAEIFWPLYDAYRVEADSILSAELLVLEDYMMHYYLLSEERAKKLMAESIAIKREKLSLQEKYTEIMAKSLPYKVVGKFFQINNRLDLMISQQNSEKIPLIRKQD